MNKRAMTPYDDVRKFSFNDLRYWVWAFDQFIGDVSDLIPGDEELPEQYNLEQLDNVIEQELEDDFAHQQFWWMEYDRAAEAIPMLESDGPESIEYPMHGEFSREAYEEIRNDNKQEAYINLVASNVERKMGSLTGFIPSFKARAVYAEDYQAVRHLNHWVREIKDNVNLDLEYNRFKWEGITIGSGVLKISHGPTMQSPDLALFRNLIQKRDFITPEELERFEEVFEYHDARVIPSFHVIRFREAAGPQSVSFDDPIHRQVHWFENISVAEAKMRYPDYKEEISAQISDIAQRASPHLALVEGENQDSVTITHHRIKFPVIEELNMRVGYPGDSSFEIITREKPRYAIGYITRIEGVGIVDMDLDTYNHNGFDLVQWNSYPSSKHSCGIGHVKFGRDPAIVHNKLHNGMLDFFGRQIKGGGFYLDGVIEDDQIKEMSKGTRWIKINREKLPFNMKNAKLGDIIQDNRPPSFPTAWANLMSLEEQATDRSMRASGAWKGERAGYSGVQQQIASQDAGMMHSNTSDLLEVNSKEIGYKFYSNVIQFDGSREISFRRENESGMMEDFVLNKPGLQYQEWDPADGYRLATDHIINDLSSLQFRIEIIPRSLVPDKPVEKAQFYLQQLQYMGEWFKDPDMRIALRNFSNQGMHIPGILETVNEIDSRQSKQSQMQAELADRAEQYEQLKTQREWAKDKAEIDQNLLRLMQKFIADLVKANPETLQALLSGNYPALQQDLTSAIEQLTGGASGADPIQAVQRLQGLSQNQPIQQ